MAGEEAGEKGHGHLDVSRQEEQSPPLAQGPELNSHKSSNQRMGDAKAIDTARVGNGKKGASHVHSFQILPVPTSAHCFRKGRA